MLDAGLMAELDGRNSGAGAYLDYSHRVSARVAAFARGEALWTPTAAEQVRAAVIAGLRVRLGASP